MQARRRKDGQTFDLPKIGCYNERRVFKGNSTFIEENQSKKHKQDYWNEHRHVKQVYKYL